MASPNPGLDDLPTPLKIPEEDARDLPVALSASVVLTALPRDGLLALDKASNPKPARGTGVLSLAIYNRGLIAEQSPFASKP